MAESSRNGLAGEAAQPNVAGSPTNAGKKTAISLSSVMEYDHVPHDFTDEMLGLLSLVAPASDEEIARAPCDLSLVIDKSGSMAGRKLELVIQACKFVLAQLDERDRLGVVMYDTHVSELHPLSNMDFMTKQTLIEKLNGVRDGSSTNLSGGLLEGLRQHYTGPKVYPWIFDTDEPRTTLFAIGNRTSEPSAPDAKDEIYTLYVQWRDGAHVIEKVHFKVKIVRSTRGNWISPFCPPSPQHAENTIPLSLQNNVASSNSSEEIQQQMEEEFEIIQMPNAEVQQQQGQQQHMTAPPPPPASARLRPEVEVTSAPFEIAEAFSEEMLPRVYVITVTFKDGSEKEYEHSIARYGSETMQRVTFTKPAADSNPVVREVARSVFLFTDGLANNGITITSGIIAAAKGAIKNINGTCTVNCFGFGDDHDAGMLNGVAEACGGDYMYIENEEAISTSFAQALGGLLSVVAQNITVVVDSEYVTKYPDFKRDGKKLILGDMFAEERRDLLVHFKPAPQITDLGTVSIHYFNLLTSKWDEDKIPITLGRAETLSAANASLAFHRERVKTVRVMHQAKQFGEEGQLDRARELITDQLAVLAVMDDERSKSLQCNLLDVQQDMVDTRSFRAKASKKMQWHMNSNQKQRAMGAPASMFTCSAQNTMAKKATAFFSQ